MGIYVQWPMLSKPGLESPANVSSNYIWVADINDVIDETYLQVEIITNYTHADALMSDYITCISKNGTNGKYNYRRLEKQILIYNDAIVKTNN